MEQISHELLKRFAENLGCIDLTHNYIAVKSKETLYYSCGLEGFTGMIFIGTDNKYYCILERNSSLLKSMRG